MQVAALPPDVRKVLTFRWHEMILGLCPRQGAALDLEGMLSVGRSHHRTSDGIAATEMIHRY
jgi:hypothetical protein